MLMSTEAWEKILKAIQMCTALDVHVAFGLNPAEMKQLMCAVSSNLRIKSLRFIHNNSVDTNIHIRSLAVALQTNTTLTSLDLSYQIISKKVEWLAKALCCNHVLKSLNLTGNDIDVAGAKLLAKALRVNQTLTTLNLRDNDMGPEGIAKLAKALRTHITLTYLNVRSNNMGDKGTLSLAIALYTNTALMYLNVGCNKMTHKGAELLANALRINRTLVHLNIKWNQIKDEGVKAFEKVLRSNHTLKCVNIKWNRVSALRVKALKAVLGNRRGVSGYIKPLMFSTDAIRISLSRRETNSTIPEARKKRTCCVIS